MNADLLGRIMKYCASGEKCTHDVTTKLISWGVSPEETEVVLIKLRKEKFLDDDRYVRSFFEEKWLSARWGRIKIAHALRQKHIPDHLIDKYLAWINEEDYQETLHQLLQNKWDELKSGNKMSDIHRIQMFATGRGFEEELIHEWLEKKQSESDEAAL
jgi:regulatory protein